MTTTLRARRGSRPRGSRNSPCIFEPLEARTLFSGSHPAFFVLTPVRRSFSKLPIFVTMQHLSDPKLGAPISLVGDTPNQITGTTIHGVAGQPLTAILVSIPSNVNPFRLEAPLIRWGDGATSNGTLTQNSDGSFSVTGSHLYAHAGTFHIVTSVILAPVTQGPGFATPDILIAQFVNSTAIISAAVVGA
jgi:hypothetical protein